MKTWVRYGIDKLFPIDCVLCHQRVVGHPAICSSCSGQLPWLTNACPVCSIELSAHYQGVCGACQANPPTFQATTTLFNYAAPIDRFITTLKFSGKLAVARMLGELLAAELVSKPGFKVPDAIVPVPLHGRRLASRGYNQSHEIARPLAKIMERPILANLTLRSRPTLAQSGLSAKARIKNLKGAFTLNQPAIPKHILVVDDVITTGATVNELARTLRSGGAEMVRIAAIARSS